VAIDLENTIEYYKNLLIIQYKNKEKAAATIDLLVRTALSDNIVSQVLDGYDLEAAIGKQLDVLGKYIGANRLYADITGENFFSMSTYSTVNTDTSLGFTDYSNFNSESGSFLNYTNGSSAKSLEDDDYRIILKLKIVQNNSDHSNKSIDEGLYSFFAQDVIMSDTQNMRISYFVSGENRNIAIIAASKNILPRPMGVKLEGIIEKNKKFFGFTNYKKTTQSDLTTGFTNYTDGFTKEGEMLNYDKVTIL
jgi:hypothetical protein